MNNDIIFSSSFLIKYKIFFYRTTRNEKGDLNSRASSKEHFLKISGYLFSYAKIKIENISKNIKRFRK
jgi:hypothetical protein